MLCTRALPRCSALRDLEVQKALGAGFRKRKAEREQQAAKRSAAAVAAAAAAGSKPPAATAGGTAAAAGPATLPQPGTDVQPRGEHDGVQAGASRDGMQGPDAAPGDAAGADPDPDEDDSGPPRWDPTVLRQQVGGRGNRPGGEARRRWRRAQLFFLLRGG